jgi:hypothetical protein
VISSATNAGKLFAIFYVLIGLGMLASFLRMLAKERQTMVERRFGKETKTEG